ncbi:hypothetical protein GCM10017688_14780 [Streptomyces ramulosus]
MSGPRPQGRTGKSRADFRPARLRGDTTTHHSLLAGARKRARLSRKQGLLAATTPQFGYGEPHRRVTLPPGASPAVRVARPAAAGGAPPLSGAVSGSGPGAEGTASAPAPGPRRRCPGRRRRARAVRSP